MFHGADPTGAQALAHRLLRISGAMHGLTDRLLTAESLAEYPTGSVGAIDDASMVLRSTAGAIETAAHQIGSFRLPLSLQWHPLARLADRASPSEFHQAEADLFAQLMRAIGARNTPTAAGLPEDYFPPGYLDWLAADQAVLDAQERLTEYRRVTEGQHTFDAAVEYGLARALHERLAERSTLLFHEAIADELGETATARSEVPDFAIAAAVARSFQSGSQLLGSYLADEAAAIDDLEFVALLAAEPEAASAFFNQLGPSGTVMLAHQWADAESMGTIAPVLSQAERAGHLRFSGSDLVDADVALFGSPRPVANDSFHIEQLLLAADFSAGFVVDAARASFARHDVGDYPGAAVSAGLTDRRITAMAALLKHDATAQFIERFDDVELGALVTSSTHPYGVEHPAVGRDDLITTLFFGSIMTDRFTSDRMIDVVAGVDAQIADIRVADGLSLAMADAAFDHLGSEREAIFLDAYDQIVSSGSGLAVASTALGQMPEAFARREMVDGWFEPNASRVVAFGRFIGAIGALYLGAEASLAKKIVADRAEHDRLMLVASGVGTALSAIGTVGGLASAVAIGGVALGASSLAAVSLVALGIGVVLLGLELWSGDRDDPRVSVFADAYMEGRTEDSLIKESVLRAFGPHRLLSQAQIQELDTWASAFAFNVSAAGDDAYDEATRPYRSGAQDD